ncbi:MAG: hypothetical protein AUK64_1517 [bacterium P201]|nr:MAG: hypothetical protein AUK64_1517 [bacterium P201]
MKKCSNIIGIVLLLLLCHFVACNSKKQDTEPVVAEHSRSVEGPSHELQAIDSLMWKQPDSALSMLQEFVVSPEAEALDTFDGHYCQLLISELLYKNDFEQTNRKELLQAVAYFDSIMQVPEPVEGPSFERNAFLTARAHYINGVDYYENDSIVQACAEYLKALELMESHYEDEALKGHKARFMALTYGRLGEMFNEQLLAEPAITCYKQALLFCKREPTSIYGISVLLYNLGIQFDIANQTDSAVFYYDNALVNLPDYDNIHFRDIFATKALLNYNTGICIDSVIKDLKYVVSLTSDEEEKLTRFLTIGNILFEEKQYDSARFYLETIFEQQKDIQSKILAAENLCDIYQIKGDSIKARQYASFLAEYTMAEIEKKTDVSKINELFKNHLTQKQEKRAEKEREEAVRKIIGIIVPTAIIIILFITIFAKLRGKSRLRDKEKNHQQEIESERQTHRMEQAALSGRLKRSNQEVRKLKDQIKQLDDLVTKNEIASSFNDEPICRLIMDRVNEGQFKSKIDYIIYKDAALDKQQLLDLRLAADRHFGQFTARLKKAYPELTNSDLDYCCLYLLGLTDADIAALMQRTYNTVFERNGKIRKIFGSENPLPITLMGMAKDSSFI